MNYNREELAWAAGLFDGEGSSFITFTRRRPWNRKCLVRSLSMKQNHISVLKRFYKAIGGLGSINGPYKYKYHKHAVYEWATRKFEDVQAVIAMLWFKLDKIKRAQAKRMLRGKARDRKLYHNF